MGIDFHLGAAGPQLIEINTNAGGILLNSALARAQEACCQTMDGSFNQKSRRETLEPGLLGMFQSEWRLQRGNAPWRSVLIVDDDPSGQYLAPEFALFQQLFRQAGVQARLADPRELTWSDGQLMHAGTPVDMVYNRLTGVLHPLIANCFKP